MSQPQSEPAATRTPRVRPVPAVTRAIAVLRLLGRDGRAMTLKEIADELGLVTSTCLHILRVLVGEGLVKVDPATKRYSLGLGMLALARSVIQTSRFPALVQPMLDRLSAKWNATTIGVELTGEADLVVVALSRSPAPFGLHVDVGSRFPALPSATGRLVAAYSGFDAAELARRFQAARWDQPPDFAAWCKEVEQARSKGYSIDRGNYIGGVTVIAVPVLDGQGRMSHAVVAAGVGDQLDAAKSRALAADLLHEVQGLSQVVPAGR